MKFSGNKFTVPLETDTELASSRHCTQKMSKKKTRREGAKERLWANLTEGRSGILDSGIPSDWLIFRTDFVNTRALLTQMRYAIWRRSETFQQVTRCSNLSIVNLTKFEIFRKHVSKKDCQLKTTSRQSCYGSL